MADNDSIYGKRFQVPTAVRLNSEIMSEYSKLRRTLPIVSDKIIESEESLFNHNRITFDP